jgi:hypothetical protein
MNKIAFIVPFRAKETSKNWTLHSNLLSRTLNSILAQTSNNFIIYVVYTDLPEALLENDGIIYLKLPFDKINLADIKFHKNLSNRHKFFVMDHGRRVMFGVKEAKANGAHFVMSVDADDLISNKIAAFISDQNCENPGWYCSKGYVFIENKGWLYKQNKNMNLINGSTHIINTKYITIPNFISKPFFIHDYNLFSAHGWLKDRMKTAMNLTLNKLPFYGVFYSRNSGSHSKESDNGNDTYICTGLKKWVKLLLRSKKMNKHIVSEFSYNPIN